MAQINITMDNWMYARLMRTRPKGITKSEWMRELAMRGLEATESASNGQTKSEPARNRTGVVCALKQAYVQNRVDKLLGVAAGHVVINTRSLYT